LASTTTWTCDLDHVGEAKALDPVPGTSDQTKFMIAVAKSRQLGDHLDRDERGLGRIDVRRPGLDGLDGDRQLSGDLLPASSAGQAGSCPARDAVTHRSRVPAASAALDVGQVSTKIGKLSVHRRGRNRLGPKRQDGSGRNLTMQRLQFDGESEIFQPSWLVAATMRTAAEVLEPML